MILGRTRPSGPAARSFAARSARASCDVLHTVTRKTGCGGGKVVAARFSYHWTWSAGTSLLTGAQWRGWVGFGWFDIMFLISKTVISWVGTRGMLGTE
jgi:hypothetical protein